MSTTIAPGEVRRRLVGLDSWLYAARVSGIPQVGFVTSSGSTLTGAGTLFTQNFTAGDVLTAANQFYTILTVADDAHVTVSPAPSPALLNAPFGKSITYDDTYIQSTVVPAAIRRFEREMDFRINQVQVCSLSDGVYAPAMTIGQIGQFGGVGSTLPSGFPLPAGTPYLIEPPYTWWKSEFNQWGRIPLKHHPVILPQRYRVLWNQGQNVFTIPPEWLHADFHSGDCWLIPYSNAAAIGSAFTAIQILTAAYGDSNYVPGVVSIDYVAGLASDWQSDPQWFDLNRCVTECCAYQILCDIDQAFDAGAKSSAVSAAGWSQDIDWDRFEGKKQQLQQSYMAFKDTIIRDQGTGFQMGTG